MEKVGEFWSENKKTKAFKPQFFINLLLLWAFSDMEASPLFWKRTQT